MKTFRTRLPRAAAALLATAIVFAPLTGCGEGGNGNGTTPAGPTETDDPSVRQGVTAGAFCSPEGARGRTSTGRAMICTKTPEDDRARWRAA